MVLVLQLGRGSGAIRDDDCPVHDGMDTADILILPWRQARVRVRIIGKHHARIKRAALTILKTADVRHGVFRRCGIFPSNWGTSRHRSRFWNEVWRSAVDDDCGVGRCGGGRPGSPHNHSRHGQEHFYGNDGFHVLVFFISILPRRSRRQVVVQSPLNGARNGLDARSGLYDSSPYLKEG